MSAYEDTVASGERTKDAGEIAEGYDTAGRECLSRRGAERDRGQ